VTVAGSFRRMRETVGDLDVLVTAAAGSPVMQRFTAYDEVADVLSAGGTRASVVLKSGLQVDLRVVAQQAYGAALHYFTGSKAHNIAIRRSRRSSGSSSTNTACSAAASGSPATTRPRSTPASACLSSRPNCARIAARSRRHAAGACRRWSSIPTCAATCTPTPPATDGHDSLREMALAAKALGLHYLAITEHSRRLTVAHGLDPLRLARQCDEIDRLNSELDGITLLKGIEVDILEDGSLDLPDEVLGGSTWWWARCTASSSLSRAKQTARILAAMDHPTSRCWPTPAAA
jgi:DNA polymerase (family X)